MSERLNKHLALQLGVSRREADELIEKGSVLVNATIAILGQRIELTDAIIVNGKKLGEAVDYEYIALHKPEGYVSSRKQQGESPTLYDLLPKSLHHLKTVGRLDRESSGIILLTNDGDYTFEMTHPKFYKTKIYEVSLDHPLQPLHQQIINDHGINLEDGVSQLILERTDDSREHWIVTMHEGRNRQIRRTFAALGYNVIRLHRTTFGAHHLGELKPGEFTNIEK